MSVPSQGGLFAIAPQNGRFGDANQAQFVSANHNFRKMRATRIGFGTQQEQQPFPFEVGGNIVPTGAFKAGVFAAGDVDFIPRAEDVLGYLLWAALGDLQTTTNAMWDGVSGTDTNGGLVANINTHIASFDPSGSFIQPWMAVRCYVPGSNASNAFGEEAIDAKINALRITIPASGLLQATVSMIARAPKYPDTAEVNTWTYANEYENSLSVPHAGRGEFLIGGQEYPITAASFELMNGLTTPQQERVVGSYYPDDFVALSRQAQVRIVYKWENPQLYRRMLTGQPIGETEWQSIPFQQDTQGATKALEATFYSPGTMPGSDDGTGAEQPYMMKIVANRVVWSIDQGGIELAPGNIIMVPFVGTILEPAAGQNYVDIVLHNQATYTWDGDTIPPVLTLPLTVAFDELANVPETVSPGALASDPENVGFNTGSLSVEMTAGATTTDALQIGTTTLINDNAGTLEFNGAGIGTITGDGTTATPLSITFTDPAATDVAVTELLRAIEYVDSGGSDATSEVTVTYTLTDANGTVVTKTLTIQHV